MAGADGNRQCVELGALDEIGCLLGVGQHLFARHGGVGAVAIFLVALHGFQTAQAAEFAFHGNASGVRQIDHLARDFNVVLVAGDGLAIGHQRAVHHDRAETQVDRALANVGVLTVVLVHDQRNMRIGLDRRQNQMLDEGLTRVLAGARAGLQDDWRANLLGRRHDGLHLFQVVDIESRNAVAVGRGMVEQFAHGNKSHDGILQKLVIGR